MKRSESPSKYVAEPHLVIAVDGVPLDMALGVEGLVSSLLGCPGAIRRAQGARRERGLATWPRDEADRALLLL